MGRAHSSIFNALGGDQVLNSGRRAPYHAPLQPLLLFRLRDGPIHEWAHATSDYEGVASAGSNKNARRFVVCAINLVCMVCVVCASSEICMACALVHGSRRGGDIAPHIPAHDLGGCVVQEAANMPSTSRGGGSASGETCGGPDVSIKDLGTDPDTEKAIAN